jgi:protease I
MKILNIEIGGSEKDTFKAAPTPKRLKKNRRIAILTADKTQDLEFFYPYYRFCEEGYEVDVITIRGGSFEGKQGMGLKETLSIDQVRPDDYALLYIPGGKAPAELRKDDKVLAFVRLFALSGKPIAAICHGAQLLISAGLARGKRMACWPEVREELEEAGGLFADEALVEDGQFITARMPGDLPRHLWGTLDILQGHGDPMKRSA